MKINSTVILFLFLISSLINAQSALNISDFKNPPQSAKVQTWWHWMAGNITKDGITKDLEAMKAHGIVQATILNIGEIYSKEVDVPKVKFNSFKWIEMYQWALQEAKRSGITLGIHNCDGWGTSGGPWITPELSMMKYVWTKTSVQAEGKVNIKLDQPVVLENFYRDVAVVAFPATGVLNSFRKAVKNIEVNKAIVGNVLSDGNPDSEINFKKGDIIDITFKDSFDANKLVIFPHLPFSYKKTFDLPANLIESKRISLNLGSVKNVAEVWLNGKNLGVVWCEPYQVDITYAVKPTGNNLEVKVVNLWHNRLTGDARLPKNQRITKTNVAINPDTELLDSGLLGPVNVLIAE